MMSGKTKIFWAMVKRAVKHFHKNYVFKPYFKITLCNNKIVLVTSKKGVHFMVIDYSSNSNRTF